MSFRIKLLIKKADIDGMVIITEMIVPFKKILSDVFFANRSDKRSGNKNQKYFIFG